MKQALFFVGMILLFLLGLLLELNSCSSDQFQGLTLPDANRFPDTLVSEKPYQVPLLKRPDVPAIVTNYPVDTALAQKAKNQPIILNIRKKRVKKLFKKERHLLEITRIDQAAEIQTLTYDIISPDIDYTITPQGLQTDPKSIKKAKRRLFWRKVGNTAKDIGKVAGGAAVTYIIMRIPG